MPLWRAKTLRLSLAISVILSLIPSIAGTVGAAGNLIEATVNIQSTSYDPGETVTASIDLQNNDVRRARVDVRLSIVDPNGNPVHGTSWSKVRIGSTIQLSDSFQAGTVPGTYLVGLNVTAKSGRTTETYVMDDAIASFYVANDQQEPVNTPQPEPSPPSDPASVLFGIYPGGGNGELGFVEPPSAEVVIDKLNELRGDRAFDIHLFTAWSWYNQRALSSEIEQYTAAGMHVTLTVKYSPPSGREGDIEGFVAFLEQVIEAHAANPLVHRIVVGNEVNVVNGNPSSSDGPFAGVKEATIAGVQAARAKLDGMDRRATKVGISLAVLERETDARFLNELATLGGDAFRSSVDFMGLNVYPGMWPIGTGDPYADMVTHLRNGRYSLSTAGFASDVDLAVLENGFPTSDAELQYTKIDGFLRAVCDVSEEAGLASYSWFDLWDANSDSTSPYAHYGLLRSDMTPKPSFAYYRDAIASGCSSS